MQQFKKNSSFDYWILLLIIAFTSVLLSLWKIGSSTIFIGDQAWFYLSARDLLLGKSFPLVGITSSHTWLHQGPLWTYLLAISLWVGRFNPISGAYLSVGINALTILFLYLLGKRMFSKRVALIGSVLYAFSPYLLYLSRMPYHTTPIPLLTLFYFYCLTQWSKGKRQHLKWIFSLLALLYNFELATVILLGPVIVLATYGFLKKKEFITKLTKKDIYTSILLGVLPLIPVITYDIGHGFKQTLGYGAWLIYTAVKAGFGFLSSSHSSGSFLDTGLFLFQRLSWLVFLPNLILGIALLLFSIGGVVFAIRQKKQKNEEIITYILLLLWLLFTIGIFVMNKVASDAYIPSIFVAIFFAVGVAFEQFFYKKNKVIIVVIGVVLLLNTATLLTHNYSMNSYEDISLSQRLSVADTIIKDSQGRPFDLYGAGAGSQFESFTMPYEYLLWYKGHPSNKNAQKIFLIEEKSSKIIVTQKK